MRYDSRLILVAPGLFALASACTLLEVPFEPSDGSGATTGSGGGPDAGGHHSGGNTWHEPTGGGTFESGGTFGYGGEVAEPELVLGADFPIAGLGVTDEYIYWMTEGSFSGDGESNHDGALFRMGVDGGYIQTAAAALDQPTRLEMTETSAYIWGASPTVAYRGFLAFDLASTSYQTLDVGGAPPALFAAFEDRAYVSHDLGPDSGVFEHMVGQEPRQVIWGIPKDIAADATHVYFTTTEGELSRAPLDDPTSTQLLASDITEDFALLEDEVLLIRGASLAALPKAGGELTEKLTLEPGRPYYELRVAGDRYFASRYEEADYVTVYTGLASRGDCERVWTLHWDDLWLGRPDHFYTTTGTYVQRKALD